MRRTLVTHNTRKKSAPRTGVTLVEVLVTIGIIAVLTVMVSQIASTGFLALANARARIAGLEIANEKLEVIRNMTYDAVGTTTGWPAGAILSTQSIERSGITFTVGIRVDWVDDPFDGNIYGTIPDKPVDTVSNDYKRAEVTVRWSKAGSTPVVLSTTVVPKGLETPSNTGSLTVKVFDSRGVGVPQATVTITNPVALPGHPITNTTDNDGNLQVLALPPVDDNSYSVEATKDGYSTERTYSTSVYPKPDKSDVSVFVGQVTPVSLSIDRVSTLAVSTQGENCVPIGNVPLSIQGEKLIAHDPDVKKFQSTPPTDAVGRLLLSSLEWDNYTLTQTSSSYDVAGIIPPVFLNILPATTQNISLVLKPKTANSLHVTVKDAADSTTITGATAHLTKTGYDESLLTGIGYFVQSDWSGGSGQDAYTDTTKFFSDDGNVDITSSTGEVTLASTNAPASKTESFDTDTYRDAAATTADWNTAQGRVILPSASGEYADSAVAHTLKLNTAAGKITTATLTVEETLNGQTVSYELSADGGATFEPVSVGIAHPFSVSGTDLRIRINLTTGDRAVTPVVDAVTVDYTVTTYQTEGSLVSSTLDMNTVSSDPRIIQWDPTGQVPAVGPDSVRVQVAANSDNTTWTFVGPDGTEGTYYATSGETLPASFKDKRYLRYKLYLKTASQTVSPTVSLVTISYTSGCIPQGQVFFPGLSATSYVIDVIASGYQAYSNSVPVSGATKIEISLSKL